jgi:hypothetical protein
MDCSKLIDNRAYWVKEFDTDSWLVGHFSATWSVGGAFWTAGSEEPVYAKFVERVVEIGDGPVLQED